MGDFCINNLRDNQRVNTTLRSNFQKRSWWYRFTHSAEKLVVDYDFYTKVLRYFDKNFNINDLAHTARIWDFVLKTHKISWNKEDSFSGAKFKKIYKAFEDTLVYSGKGVECSLECGEDIRMIGEYLLAKDSKVPLSFFRWENLQKVLVSLDQNYLEEFRAMLGSCLKKGLESFNAHEISEEIFEGFVYNILSLLPFTYPKEGIQLQIPVKINGHWELVDYKLDKQFTLSPKWFSSPIPAYGWVSDHPLAPPMITCMGSTYPAGKGFIATWLSDCTPGLSVGHAPSLYGKKEIAAWLKDKKGVHVTGASLGGATAMHLSRQHPNISSVHAFNPPGLYPWDWKGANHKHVAYTIYSNSNDLVSTMGIFPEGDNVKVYRLLSQNSDNFLSAHAKTYCAAQRVTMLLSSATYENGRLERKILTVMHLILSPLIFLTILSFHLIYRICEFVYRQISKLCYTRSVKGEKDHAGAVRSSAGRDPESPPVSEVKA